MHIHFTIEDQDHIDQYDDIGSIHIWFRPRVREFEWNNTEKKLILRPSKPLFYCQFDGADFRCSE